MLSVTFQQPIHIDAANLHSLLSLANTPAVVEPYLNGHAAEVMPQREGRKPRLTNGDPHAKAVPKEDKPKRTRRTKAEMLAAKEQASPPAGPETGAAATTEAETAAEAPAVVDAPKKPGRKPKADAAKSSGSGAAVTHTSEALMERFAKLIDADFGQASGLLEGFGVKRFSELKDSEYGAFDGKLTELGV